MNVQKNNVVANLGAVSGMIDEVVAKMEAGTASTLEVDIVSSIADCLDSCGVMAFSDLLDQCEEAFGYCPFSGCDEWPEDTKEQVSYLKSVSENIKKFTDNPPKKKVKVSTNFTVMVENKITERCLPFSAMPAELKSQLLIPYDDEELKIS